MAEVTISTAAQRSSYVPHKDLQAEVAGANRTIFNAPDRVAAEAYLPKAATKDRGSASHLSE